MKLQNAITVQLHTQRRFFNKVNCGEMLFTDYKDFREVLRFLRDIKRDLYETDYQWKFDAFCSIEKQLVEIRDKKGVERNAGIEQCLDWLRRNGAEVIVHNPNINERTSLLSSSPTAPTVLSI